MKSTTSISFTAGFFMYFLFVSYYNHAEDIYTPLKQSIIEGNISMAAMFGLDLLAILTIAIARDGQTYTKGRKTDVQGCIRSWLRRHVGNNPRLGLRISRWS